MTSAGKLGKARESTNLVTSSKATDLEPSAPNGYLKTYETFQAGGLVEPGSWLVTGTASLIGMRRLFSLSAISYPA